MSSDDVTTDGQTPIRPAAETPTQVMRGDEAPEPERQRVAPQLAPGTVLGQRYRIVAPLGSGGMGEVYRADDLRLGQTVALKFVSRARPDLNRQLLEEVRIGREISHPNVCRLYDIAEVDGHIFISMEFISGEDLASLLRRVGRLPAERAITVARQICAGIAAAHDHGVVHRDLKPANVMIDGRGRARITDFGLAIVEDSASRHVNAGTPAYMAPEQLAGKPATVQSDLYAFGLILYELFTGRRAFDAKSTRELVAKQRASEFEQPSLAVKDIPPSVERVIVRCLDPDPTTRPSSAETVLQELPGSDALTAAVAAGETPSPEMVTAAAARGHLAPWKAWLMLLFVLAGLVGVAILSRRTTLYARSEIKPPQVLEDKALSVIDAVAPGLKQIDTATEYVEEEGSIRFLHRQSPKLMRPRNSTRRVMKSDPPVSVPGMASVTLLSDGRLRELVIVPPATRTPAAGGQNVPWAALLRAAGFDETRLVAASPEWTAPVDSDTKRGWTDSKSGQHIEGASYQGRCVWFAVRDRVAPVTQSRSMNVGVVSLVIIIAMMLALPIAAILLAWRNVARRRGDYRGAFLFSVSLLALSMVGVTLRAHHAIDNPIFEWAVISLITATLTFWALVAFLTYIAVEPLVRRRWPQMLISWMRLLDGRFGDAMIGRDLLVGAAGGIVIILAWHLAGLFGGGSPIELTDFPRTTLSPLTLGGGHTVISTLLLAIFESMMRSISAVMLLIVMRGLLRSDRATNVVTVVLLALSFLADGNGTMITRAIYALICATVVVVVLRRFGLLALIAAGIFVATLWRVPVTLDRSTWYFGNSVIALLFLAAIAIYGFERSTAGQKRFPGIAFEA
jgi:serine/threonine-protein kinase